MERIAKEFKSGEILHAGEMNYLVACINQAIETINKSVSTIAPAVKRDVKVVNMHIKTHGGTGTIFQIPAATEQYAGVVVVDDKISKDSKNPVQNKALYEALEKFSAAMGAWGYSGKVETASDVDSIGSIGNVFLAEDDDCLYVVTYKEDFTELYVTINGHTYTVDTTKAVSIDDLTRAMTEMHPFEENGFETLPLYIGNSPAQLIPVLTEDGYTIAICQTNADEDGVAIIRILNESTYSSMNSAECGSFYDDQRYAEFYGEELPAGSLLIRPFGSHIDKLSIATKDYVDSKFPTLIDPDNIIDPTEPIFEQIPVLVSQLRNEVDSLRESLESITYETHIEESSTSQRAPTTQAVAEFVKIDSEMSSVSTNAVQNRIVKRTIDDLMTWH